MSLAVGTSTADQRFHYFDGVGRRPAPGVIHSHDDDVTLTSPASILDVDEPNSGVDGPSSAVTGVDITLTAATAIGTASNLLEIDSSNPRDGMLTATALAGIFINEVSGDLRVNKVVSTPASSGAAASHAVMLETLNGSILDARLTPESTPANVTRSTSTWSPTAASAPPPRIS